MKIKKGAKDEKYLHEKRKLFLAFVVFIAVRLLILELCGL